MRAQNSSQRSQSDSPFVLPVRRSGGGAGSTRATLDCGASWRPRVFEAGDGADRRAEHRSIAEAGPSIDRPIRRKVHAALGIDAMTVDGGWRQDRVGAVLVRHPVLAMDAAACSWGAARARLPAPVQGPQPRDADRRVAGAALVVRQPSAADRRARRQLIGQRRGRRRPSGSCAVVGSCCATIPQQSQAACRALVAGAIGRVRLSRHQPGRGGIGQSGGRAARVIGQVAGVTSDAGDGPIGKSRGLGAVLCVGSPVTRSVGAFRRTADGRHGRKPA